MLTAAVDERGKSSGQSAQFLLKKIADRNKRHIGEIDPGTCCISLNAVRRGEFPRNLTRKVKSGLQAWIIKRFIHEDMRKAVVLSSYQC